MKGKQISFHFLLSAQTTDKSINANDLTVIKTGLKSNKGSVIIKILIQKIATALKKQDHILKYQQRLMISGEYSEDNSI